MDQNKHSAALAGESNVLQEPKERNPEEEAELGEEINAVFVEFRNKNKKKPRYLVLSQYCMQTFIVAFGMQCKKNLHGILMYKGMRVIQYPSKTNDLWYVDVAG